MYRKEFKGKGLYDARVGYIGGDSKNPSYRAVCSGSSGRMSAFSDLLLFLLSSLRGVCVGLDWITANDLQMPKRSRFHSIPQK